MSAEADSETGIAMYFHCRRCLMEKPGDQSPREWARIEVGLRPDGSLRVWCKRHNMKVADLGKPSSVAPKVPSA